MLPCCFNVKYDDLVRRLKQSSKILPVWANIYFQFVITIWSLEVCFSEAFRRMVCRELSNVCICITPLTGPLSCCFGLSFNFDAVHVIIDFAVFAWWIYMYFVFRPCIYLCCPEKLHPCFHVRQSKLKHESCVKEGNTKPSDRGNFTLNLTIKWSKYSVLVMRQGGDFQFVWWNL